MKEKNTQFNCVMTPEQKRRLDELAWKARLTRSATVRKLIDDAYKLGVGIVVRTCLESGLLTGKYKPGHVFTGKDQRSRYAKENLEFILSTVGAMEKRLVRTPYKSLSEVAIKFAMVPKGTSSVIIGARTKTQVERNLKVARLPDLSEDLIKLIVDSYGDITDKANYS